MERSKPNFRLRLNLFDALVLVLALAVGAFLVWRAVRPQAAETPEIPLAQSTYRYTVCFQRWPEGDSALIQLGDELMDSTKNYPIGHVVSYEVVPAYILTLDQTRRRQVLAPVPGYEDIYVTVESAGTDTGDKILLGGGFALQAGVTAFIRGQGYVAAGPITNVERGEVQS